MAHAHACNIVASVRRTVIARLENDPNYSEYTRRNILREVDAALREAENALAWEGVPLPVNGPRITGHEDTSSRPL